MRSKNFVSWRVKEFEFQPNAPMDYFLLFVVVTLVFLGVVMVYAATYHLGFRYLTKQLGRSLIGLFSLWVGTKLNINQLAKPKVRWVLLMIFIGLLIATLCLGEVVGVTKRNLLGIFQPAEFAKFVLIIWLAGYFADLREESPNPNFVDSVVKPGLVVMVVILLTLFQPAVGTSFIIALSSLIIFILAGVRWRYVLLICFLAGLVGLVGLTVVMPFLKDTKYRYIPERLEKFRQGDRYQQRQALIALGSGGPFGRGLGEGRQKYYFLPKLPKDFIFCAIGEEFGFWGTLGTMVLYLVFLIRGLRIGRKAVMEFGQYLAAGVTIVIFLYALIHQAVSLSVLPTTGQPLPFISYGGSALVANLLAAGMLLKVSRFRRNGVEESFNGRRWNRWAYLSGAGTRP